MVLRGLGPAETKGRAQDGVPFTLFIDWALVGEGQAAALPGLPWPWSQAQLLAQTLKEGLAHRRAAGAAAELPTLSPRVCGFGAVEAVPLEILLCGSCRVSDATAPRQRTPLSPASAIPSHGTTSRARSRGAG